MKKIQRYYLCKALELLSLPNVSAKHLMKCIAISVPAADKELVSLSDQTSAVSDSGAGAANYLLGSLI